VISLILSSAARFLVPLFIVFSLFMLYRGHDNPGGGFIGGLVGAAAFGLHMIAYDVQAARKALRVEPRIITAVGLLVAAAAGVIAFLDGEPFLTGQWIDIPVIDLHLGTPLLFDVGVYLVVMGALITMMFTLAEEEGD
jgi:multicomponent Na+:H+ antiporter subunit B